MSNKRISEWFYLYSNDIYQFLIYYLGSSDVEDLVQEVFIRAIRNIETFEEKSSPKTWLISIARHVGIDEIRRRQRAKWKSYLVKRTDDKSDFQTPEHFLELDETHKELYAAIQGLKENYREVIILRAIKELSVEETAEILNWKDEKVSITFHRAIKALRKEKERFV